MYFYEVLLTSFAARPTYKLTSNTSFEVGSNI